MRTKNERKALQSTALKPSIKTGSDTIATTGGEQIIKEGGVWYKLTHIKNKKMYTKLSDKKD